jgi:hypothetical protein
LANHLFLHFGARSHCCVTHAGLPMISSLGSPESWKHQAQATMPACKSIPWADSLRALLPLPGLDIQHHPLGLLFALTPDLGKEAVQDISWEEPGRERTVPRFPSLKWGAGELSSTSEASLLPSLAWHPWVSPAPPSLFISPLPVFHQGLLSFL